MLGKDTKRIMIIGGSGSGKTTLATRLGEAIDLPVHFIDQMFWKPNWVQRDKQEIQAMMRKAIATDRWIIEGNNSSTFQERVSRADVLIFLDVATPVRVWRIISRTLNYWGRTRPEFTENCPERFDAEFSKFVIFYRTLGRPKALHLMETAPETVQVFHLRSRRSAQQLLQTLSQIPPHPANGVRKKEITS